MLERDIVPKALVLRQLEALGVRRDGVLIVHTAFSRVRPVQGGVEGLIETLRRALGPRGTLVMPSMTDDDDTPFDPRTTACRDMGVVADTFWRLPGVRRSDSPHAFAAVGPRAEALLTPHPADFPHGPDSPVGRVLEFDGQVLLLGVNHDANTTVHLAESLAGVRYRRPKHVTVLRDGDPMRVDYEEIDHCCERFQLVDEWLDSARLQTKGRVGHAEARLMRSRDVVDQVLRRLQLDETLFLHPRGFDPECDEARDSIPTGSI